MASRTCSACRNSQRDGAFCYSVRIIACHVLTNFDRVFARLAKHGLEGRVSRPYTGAKIAQLSREVFAIAGDGAFTEVALKIYVSRFPPAQRSRMATRAVVRKVTGASPLTTSRP